MDIEKLIERLGENTDCWTDKVHGYADLRLEASTALSTLQAENEKLKDQLYDGEGVNLVNYWMQQAKIEENGHRNCQAENEQLRAEVSELRQKLAEAEADNKKLCAVMMQIKRIDRPERASVIYALEYDSSLSHKTMEEVAGIFFRGLMDADLKLRGQKEE